MTSRSASTARKARIRARSGMSAIMLAGVALAAACASTMGDTAKDPAIASTGNGKVRGDLTQTALVFKGIRYAAAPVAENRWREPMPVDNWSGIRDATRFGPDCIQPVRDTDEEPHPQSEDCLALNVARPLEASDEKRPVLFYVHGGAYYVGAGRSVLEDGAPELVQDGAIIVAPNYRLGRMGFFAHPALSEEAAASGAETANYWLMDEIAALKWVEENIAEFGGDPENVTLLGCSAGGSSVNALLASPEADGLFNKAVVRSGGGFFNATRSLALAEQQGADFAERAGVDSAGDTALPDLRDLTAEDVLAADPGPPNYGAIVDGTLLESPISVAMADGKTAPVPLITGSTSNEASVFGLMGFDKAVMKARFGIDVDALRPIYETDEPLSDEELLRQVQTDFLFTSASLGMAALSSAAGRPSWAYHFDYVPAAERADTPGADHCADMPYLFAPGPLDTPEDQAVADLLQGQLLQFMKTGNPNGPGLPEWPQVGPGHLTPLVVRTEVHAEPGFRSNQLAPWYEKWSSEKERDFPASARKGDD